METKFKVFEEKVASSVYANLKEEILKETKNIETQYKNKMELGFSRGRILRRVFEKLQNQLDIDSNMY